MAATKRQAAGLTNAIPRSTLNDEELVRNDGDISKKEISILSFQLNVLMYIYIFINRIICW